MVVFSLLIQYFRPPFIRNIRVVKFWVQRIFVIKLAYIKNIFVKLIFKTFPLENAKKKDPNILPRQIGQAKVLDLYYVFGLSNCRTIGLSDY
jgi:hypothetical protein